MDDAVCARWAESSYLQYFGGEDYFEQRLSYASTNLGRFLQALDEAGVEELRATTIAVAASTKAVAPNEFKQIVVDTAVQEKAIAFPTDSRLLEVVRAKLAVQAQRAGLALKQTYELEGKRLRDIERKIAAARQSHQVALKTWLARTWRIRR